jgi:hypothetical protein
VVKDGDHSFASGEQTADLIRYTLEWLEQFRHRHVQSTSPVSIKGEHGLSSSSATH